MAKPNSNRSAGLAAEPRTLGSSAVLVVYAGAMFVGAVLLFSVQPMFAKMLLPRVGGTPGVWTTAMLFSQAVLLVGYGYAHLATRWLGARRQAVLHCLLLVAALALLPVMIPADWTPPAVGDPTAWMLAALVVGVGGPMAIVSSTAPLLQRWLAGAAHRDAHDPYFLYVASNFGSAAALLGYPTLIEPALDLTSQARWWSYGYLLLIGLTGVAAVLLWRSSLARAAPNNAEQANDARRRSLEKIASVPWRERLAWIALAFAPSSWMLGVTTHLTTDLAPVPLLWVIPLFLYLLTFILVFARRPLMPHALMRELFPLALILLVTTIIVPARWQVLLVHLAAFFIGAMLCHGELARRRPPAARLTEFYFWLSLGGVLGGVFNAVIAPRLFSTVLEYPLAVALTCLLPVGARAAHSRLATLGMLAGATLLLALMLRGLQITGVGVTPGRALLVLVGAPLLCVFYYVRRPRWFAAVAAVVLIYDQFASPVPGELIYTARSFFGVHRVVRDADARPERFHRLLHGTTQHGLQHVDPERACEPLGYYHREGPLGSVFRAYPPGEDETQRVAVVGLGAGASACHASAERVFTFHEIDPAVVRIAESPELFSYLNACGGANYRVVLGDGRLRLAEAEDAGYQIIVLDAFSSDAVPVHLLTREAVQTYLSKLTPGGVLVFHVSNLHLDLVTVVGAVTNDLGLACLVMRDDSLSEAAQDAGRFPSTYVAAARSEADLAPLGVDGWREVQVPPDARPWTDGYSNIFGALKWRPVTEN